MDESLRKFGVVGVGVAMAAMTTGGSAAAQPAATQAAPAAATMRAARVTEPAKATPAMLQKVSPSARASLVAVRGQKISVTADQLAAYQALPDSVKAKLGAAVGGSVLSAAELRKIGNQYSTVMCPW